MVFVASCTCSLANASALAEAFQKHKKHQNNSTFNSSNSTNVSSGNSATDKFSSNLLKMRLDSAAKANTRNEYAKTTELMKKKQISSLLTAKSTSSSSLKKSLLQNDFSGNSGTAENIPIFNASLVVPNILQNTPYANSTPPSSSAEAKDGRARSVSSGSSDRYVPSSKANNFSTTFKCQTAPPADGDGLYSMSSAHVSDEGHSFLQQMSQAQRRGSFPTIAASGMSSSPFQGSLPGYSQNFQAQEGQSFDGIYGKGGYPNMAFQSLQMPTAKSNNRNHKSSGPRNVAGESLSDSLRLRFNLNNYNNGFSDDKRGLFGSTSSKDNSVFHSSLSYQLADKFSRRLFSPRLET